MALNGIFYGSTNNQFIRPKLQWSAVQSQEGNYSDITARLTYSRTNTGYTTYGTWSGSLSIGQQTKTESRVLSISYASDTLALETTARVYHDSYGSCEVILSATGGISGTTLESTQISQRIQLDTIARESTVGATDGYIGSAVTLSVRQRNPEYTHSIAWSFGDLQGFVGKDWTAVEEEVKLTDTAIAFSIPESFYSQIPDAAAGHCRLTVRTYKDQEQIGQPQESSFTVHTKEDQCAPLLTASVQDVNALTLALTGDAGVLVRGVSTARCQMDGAARCFAGIAGGTIAGREVSENTLDIENFEDSQVLFTLTDTRGYTARYDCPVTVLPYVKPSVLVTCQRTDPTSGNARLQVEGKCFAGSFGAVSNTLQISCRIGVQEEMYFTPEFTQDGYILDVELQGLVYTAAHKVTVRVWDLLAEVSQSVIVSKGIPVFHWGEKDFVFQVPVDAREGLQIAGKALWEYIYPVGSIYMSVAEASPGELFGGKWERLRDTFLLAAGEEYAPGTVGGEATHTLLEAELPSHSHRQNGWALGVTSTAHPDAYALAKPWDTHNNFEEDGSQGIQSTGEGVAHNNMPPYLAVYMWKRTA